MAKKEGTIQKSLFWSGGAEIGAKLIVPISNMLLARILTPDDFGVLAICNMVISFIDIFTDAGFGKYLVQHDFKDEDELNQSACVAFWTNLALSVILWTLVVLYRNPVAWLLGGEEYATVIAVSCMQLVFTSMISIQLGILRRKFAFKKIFVARIAVAVVPLVVTVPLAIVTRSYWALVIGNISGSIVNAVILLICSHWKPHFFYSLKLLKEMFSFSFWSLCEALAHWLIFWVDTFIIGQLYSSYYLGIYKNSANMIQSLIGMVTAALSPVLLSVLSRIKSDKDSYSIFLHIEKATVYLLFPMGIGVFFYRGLATQILFGSGWEEAANIIGAWVLMMVVSVVVYSFPAEAYKAKGMPKILFFYQLSYLVFLVPICIVTARIDFWTFVYARAACIIEQVIMCLFFMKRYLRWSVGAFVKNLIKPAIASCTVLIMYILATTVLPNTMMVEIFAIIIIVLIYFAVLILFFKKDLFKSLDVIRKKEL